MFVACFIFYTSRLRYRFVQTFPAILIQIFFASTGNIQTFIDTFIRKLLTIQAKREDILTETYQSYIAELETKLSEICQKLGIEEEEEEQEEEQEEGPEEEEEVDTRTESEIQRDNEICKELLEDLACSSSRSEDEANVEEVIVASGERRKRKNKRQGRSKQPFLVMEADISNDDSEDDEDSDDCDEIEGLINDDDMDEGDDASFYRAFDNERPGPSSATQPPETVVLSAEDRQEEKRLKNVKACLSKLTYIGQLTILGFNSQKYDVPLIRHYLVLSLIKQDSTPKQVIKKMGGFMSIATKRLKFLHIPNFLVTGTNLASFYESFQVSTPKGSFPYQWFDSLEKLEFPGLPEDQERFRSISSRLG